MAKDPVRVLVTGAAGQIGRDLAPMIARGMMLGPDQPVILHMLDIPPAAESLNGVKTELVDAAFPLLKGVVATTDVVEACTGVNIAIMFYGFPEKEGMEEKEVISKNVSIYKSQASALEKHAAANCKVLVVAIPANTNALILKEFAPSIPEKNVSCLTGLDHNKTLDQISERLNIQDSDGNHSSTQYPDVNHATVVTPAEEKPVRELVADDSWMNGKLSSALSSASAGCGHIRDWVLGTPQGTRVSMDKEKTCAEEVKMDEGIRGKVLRGGAVVGIGLAAIGVGLAAVAVGGKVCEVIGACSDSKGKGKTTVGGLVCELIGACSDSKEKGKTMKAPGRNYRILRDGFEGDPATYFRELRKSTRRST